MSENESKKSTVMSKEEKLLKEKMNNTIMVINDTENNLMIDEISGDIIL